METIADLKIEAEQLKSLGQYKESENIYDKIVALVVEEYQESVEGDRDRIGTTLADVYNERGHVRYLQVAFTEAVEDYTESIKLNDKIPIVFYNRGLIHYRLARFDAAISDMDSCLSLSPDFASAQQCRQQAIVDKEEHMNKFPQVYENK